MHYNSLAAIKKKKKNKFSDQKRVETICNHLIENIYPILQDYIQWEKMLLNKKRNTNKMNNSIIQFPLDNSSVE